MIIDGKIHRHRFKYVYISGKISGLEINEAKQNFLLASVEVEQHHNSDFTINPFDIKPFLWLKNWTCYMIADLSALKKCTHIAMQKNWIDSKGAVIEYFFAKFIFKLKIIWL